MNVFTILSEIRKDFITRIGYFFSIINSTKLVLSLVLFLPFIVFYIDNMGFGDGVYIALFIIIAMILLIVIYDFFISYISFNIFIFNSKNRLISFAAVESVSSFLKGLDSENFIENDAAHSKIKKDFEDFASSAFKKISNIKFFKSVFGIASNIIESGKIESIRFFVKMIPYLNCNGFFKKIFCLLNFSFSYFVDTLIKFLILIWFLVKPFIYSALVFLILSFIIILSIYNIEYVANIVAGVLNGVFLLGWFLLDHNLMKIALLISGLVFLFIFLSNIINAIKALIDFLGKILPIAIIFIIPIMLYYFAMKPALDYLIFPANESIFYYFGGGELSSLLLSVFAIILSFTYYYFLLGNFVSKIIGLLYILFVALSLYFYYSKVILVVMVFSFIFLLSLKKRILLRFFYIGLILILQNIISNETVFYIVSSLFVLFFMITDYEEGQKMAEKDFFVMAYLGNYKKLIHSIGS